MHRGTALAIRTGSFPASGRKARSRRTGMPELRNRNGDRLLECTGLDQDNERVPVSVVAGPRSG